MICNVNIFDKKYIVMYKVNTVSVDSWKMFHTLSMTQDFPFTFLYFLSSLIFQKLLKIAKNIDITEFCLLL